MKFIPHHGDPWHAPAGEDGAQDRIPASAHALLSLRQWHAVQHQWPASQRLGLALDNDVSLADLQALAPQLPRFDLITLPFPKWTDGRAYSLARLLRTRWAYEGELRAVGEVLVDMVPLLDRTGFDAVQLRADQSWPAARHALNAFSGHYQSEVPRRRPLAFQRYAKASPQFDEQLQASVQALQQWLAKLSEGRPLWRAVQAHSLGPEDLVITDLLQTHATQALASGQLRLAMIDTGRLHAQTLQLRRQLEQLLQVNLQVFVPATQDAQRFDQEHGPLAMRESIALRQECCHLRKVQPLAQMLAGQDGWITGRRRQQSESRGVIDTVTQDAQGLWQCNPLAHWQEGDVWHYIETRHLPYNPLHDEGMPSIGCEPCTRAITLGEDPRAGRWWWELASDKECGLHKSTS